MSQFTSPVFVVGYFSDHAAGPEERVETVSFDQSLVEEGHFVVMYRRGRFYSLEFGSEGPNEPWELHGFDVDVRPGGNR